MWQIENYSKLIIGSTVRFFGDAARKYISPELYCLSDEKCSEIVDDELFENVRYFYLMEYLKAGEIPEIIIAFQLAIAAYLHKEFYQLLLELTGAGVTLELAGAIAEAEGEGKSDYGRLYEGFLKLTDILKCSDRRNNFITAQFSADEEIILYLSGENIIPRELKGIVSCYPCKGESETKVYGMGKLREKLSELIKIRFDNDELFFIQLSGVEGSGRRTLLKAAADEADSCVVFFDYRKVRRSGREEKERMLWRARRVALLYDALLCIYGLCSNETVDDTEEILTWLEKFLNEFYPPVVICTDEKMEVVPETDLPFVKIDIPIDDLESRVDIWRGMAEEYGVSLDEKYYGSKYILPVGQLRKVFDGIKRDNTQKKDEKALERRIYEAGLRVIKRPEFGAILSDNSDRRLKDLKLPKVQSDQLEQICNYIQNEYKVFEDWKLAKSVVYGRGMTALFSGRPGTGKTMAAESIAGELSLPLYRVNLSQIIDKYIGETEKKLDKIFEYAEVSNVLLFFDEADSLFGKRSEVKEAKDKYANAEVSYILMRIERYSGAAILATNLIENIDEAFMRRMRFVVNFPMPDSETRAKIWRSSFTAEMPLEDIDFDYIADKVELAGGHIKNIVIRAAFMAASKNKCITMYDIMQSVKDEYLKLGKNIELAMFFPEYAYYLQNHSIKNP